MSVDGAADISKPRKRWIIIAVMAAVLLAAGGGAWWYSCSAGAAWLARAVQAEQVVTYQADGATSARGQQGHFLRLQGPHGAFRIVYRDPAYAGAAMAGCDGMLWVRNTQGRETTHAVTSPRLVEQPLALYRARVVGFGRVAAQPVVYLNVTDRRTGLPVLRLALDRRTAVALVTVTYDAQGKPASRTAFSRIAYRPVTARECLSATAIPPAIRLTLAQAEAKAAFRWLAPRWLPAGFTLADYRVNTCSCCNGKVIQGTYQDGLRSLVVFEHAQHDGMMCCGSSSTAGCGGSAPGGCVASNVAGAHIVSRQTGAHTVAVVGELDEPTLAKIAESVKE